MIYFDTSYLVKCYLREWGSEAVRELAAGQSSIVCCEYGRLELVVSLQRNFREGLVTRAQHRTVLRQLESDDARGIWLWLGLSPDLLRQAALRVNNLGSSVFIRAGDALHLACAAENGFAEIYSNDRHLLAAAPHFGLRAQNVIVQSR
ncbi:MAG: type II toxin-antitoxin system VapC family toxin [Verrucomicrobiota bacterium]|nr:type II toxin-antitoxin system VapC family toxin [Chthoniobacterales bacterium]MDQ3413567.1 type II toxin-antitoxin system VapC family toxin [Verrucomicrobiota bacterium]